VVSSEIRLPSPPAKTITFITLILSAKHPNSIEVAYLVPPKIVTTLTRVSDREAKIIKLGGPILITGHTGFKGTWLMLLLNELSIEAVGYSLPPKPESLYSRLNLQGTAKEVYGDIRDIKKLNDFIVETKPVAILHLAAQPLVIDSYAIPEETFEINVQGTVNVLSCGCKSKSVKAIIVATTDKVYKNNNSGFQFSESDQLEGQDPYSASKVGAESAVKAWQTMSSLDAGPKILSVRAGNVIGGGDASPNRLIPDLVRSFSDGQPASIRNPASSRPWQHVLDPLFGYLKAIEFLLSPDYKEVAALNFGPEGVSLSVDEVVEMARKNWPTPTSVEHMEYDQNALYEAKSLGLNSKRANELLGWSAVWTQESAVSRTVQWWVQTLINKVDPLELCRGEIQDYLKVVAGNSN
jgi:CDP-glucose 4,6-dehydratase